MKTRLTLSFMIFVLLGGHTLALPLNQPPGETTELGDLERSDLTPYPPESIITLDETLQWFIGRLRRLVHGLDFDNERFVKEKDLLTEQLGGIKLWGSGPFTDPHVTQKLEFAQCLFRLMLTSSQYLDYYNLRGKGYILVRNMIRLHIRALTFHDDSGFPNTRQMGYKFKVRRLARIASGWEREFSAIEDVPLSLQIVFDNQLYEVRKILRELAKHSFA